MQQWQYNFAIVCIHKCLSLQHLTGTDLPYLALVRAMLENLLHV